jgi:hypothetical protein
MRTSALIMIVSLATLGGPSSVAHAGGIGLLGQMGTHQERAYYYSTQTGEQAFDSQTRPTYGTGLEAIIGDRDDKIQGLLRMGWSADTPPNEPNVTSKAIEYPPAHEQDTRHVGVLALGVQWGVLGDPSEMQLVINSLVGSGFISVDNTEYLLLEAGVGGTYNLTPEIQAVVNLNMTARHRKRFTFGPTSTLGMRYLFD